MDQPTKNFHFQEIDWLIIFPLEGNAGKYRGYTVWLRERKAKESSEVKQVKLGDVLDRPEIDGRYPHTVGYYKACLDGKPEYLEFREIRTVEDFWAFLNSVNL